jgi:hypothetical protein
MKIAKEVHHPHNVHIYDFPTFLEEDPDETIQTGRLVTRHLDCILYFLLGNGLPNIM